MKNNGSSTIVWVLAMIAICVLAYLVTKQPATTQSIYAVCGNAMCEMGESQITCPADCGGVPGTGSCDSTTTPDIDINCFDIKNVNTALTESNNIYRKQGSTSWTTWTEGTEITNLEYGATYEFVTGISTSDFTDNAYGPHFFWTVPCKEDTEMQLQLYDDDIETALTATFYNEDDNAAAQVFAAGNIKTVSGKWYATSENYFGNPYIAVDSKMQDIGLHRKQYPNCLQLLLNSTAWDTPLKVYYTRIDGTGDELNRIPCPGISTSSSTAISYCYEAPVIDDTVAKIYMKLDADDTNAPSIDDTAYLYAGNYYTDDKGNLAWGCETDLLAYVGTDAADSLTLDFT